MSDLCPSCGRVVQKVSASCLYCGRSLGRGAAGESPPVADAVRPDGSPPTPAAVTPGDSTEPSTASRLSPAEEARRSARAAATVRLTPREREGGGFLQSTVGRLVIFTLAVIMLVLAVSTVRREREEEAPRPEPVTVDQAVQLAAEGLMPDATVDAPASGVADADVGGAMKGERVALAQRAVNQIAGWVEDYAAQYGHYPSYLGTRLDALVPYAGGEELLASLLERFEGGRVSYTRGVAKGGKRETCVVEGTVQGAPDVQVRAERSRRR